MPSIVTAPMNFAEVAMVRRSVKTCLTASCGCFTGRRTKPTSSRPAIRASIWLRVDMSRISISTPGAALAEFEQSAWHQTVDGRDADPQTQLAKFTAAGPARCLKCDIDVADNP